MSQGEHPLLAALFGNMTFHRVSKIGSFKGGSMEEKAIGMEGLWDLLLYWVGGVGHSADDPYSRQGIARFTCMEYGKRLAKAEREVFLRSILGRDLPGELQLELMELEMARDTLRDHPELIILAVRSLNGRELFCRTESFIREANECGLDKAWDACLDVDAGLLLANLIFDSWVLRTAKSVEYEESQLRITASRYVEAHELFVKHYRLFSALDAAPPLFFRY